MSEFTNLKLPRSWPIPKPLVHLVVHELLWYAGTAARLECPFARFLTALIRPFIPLVVSQTPVCLS